MSVKSLAIMEYTVLQTVNLIILMDSHSDFSQNFDDLQLNDNTDFED